MTIKTDTMAFTALLSILVALPSFGIDMSLPALGSIASSLGVTTERAGLTMSLFMVGFAVAPPFFGPVSDRVGRRPVVLAAVGLFTVASIGCSVSRSLTELLMLRVLQGMGAGVSMTSAFAIVQDLFTGAAGRAKLSYVATLMLVIPMVAPAVGSLTLTVDSWRGIYWLLSGVGAALMIAFGLLFAESVPSRSRRPLKMTTVLKAYREVSRSPTIMANIVINSAAFSTLFAYVSGSSILFIKDLGLTRGQYSGVFAVTSFGIMTSAFLNGRLSRRDFPPAYPLMIGVGLSVCCAGVFLMAIVAGHPSVPFLIATLFVGSAAFGLVAPNALHGAMQPLPEAAGSVSAVAGCLQVLAGSAASALVVSVNPGPPGLSMGIVMLVSSMVAACALFYMARRDAALYFG